MNKYIFIGIVFVAFLALIELFFGSVSVSWDGSISLGLIAAFLYFEYRMDEVLAAIRESNNKK